MSFNGGSKKMRWLSSNEADWERRHPVTLLFFLLLHLYILTYAGGDKYFLVGLVLLLLLERRLPWTLASFFLAFGVVSFLPLLIGWDVSTSSVMRQLMQLATFILGMVWISRLLRIERLLPLFSRWPRSASLLYGGWALIPLLERAIRSALRSHPRQDWRQALRVGIDSQQEEPRYAVEPFRRLRIEDGIQLALVVASFLLSVKGLLVIWLIYPYCTKGGVRDAVVVFSRWLR